MTLASSVSEQIKIPLCTHTKEKLEMVCAINTNTDHV